MSATRLAILVVGLVLCVCAPAPARAQSCGGLRAVRKEISDLSDTEWNNYVRALRGVNNNGVFARYVQIHSDNARLAHGGCYFFPWHRQFLYEFERELNRIVRGVTIPYWDWTKISSGQRINTAFSNDPMWNRRMGGANGNAPIPRAPFRNWAVGGQTVRRDFFTGRGNVGGGGDTYDLPSSEQVSAVARGSDSYADFRAFIESSHDSVHVAVGATMSVVGTSPQDPVFWSHHAYIDKIWRDWQLAGSGSAFGGRWAGGRCSRGQRMSPFSVTVSQVFSDTSLCTTYQRGSTSGPTARFSLMDVSVRQASTPALTISSDADRRSLLASIAQKKQREPEVYRNDVALGLRQIDTLQRSSRQFGTDPETIERAVTLYRNLLLKQGADVVGDASIASMSSQAIAAQGRAQAASLASGSGNTPGSGNTSGIGNASDSGNASGSGNASDSGNASRSLNASRGGNSSSS